MPVTVDYSPNSSPLSSPQWQFASSDVGPVPISSSPSSSPHWNKSSSSDTQINSQSSSPCVDPFATHGTYNNYDNAPQVSESNPNFSPENRDEIATLLPSLLFEVAREREILGSPAYARYLDFSPIKYAPSQQTQFKHPDLASTRSSSFSSSDLYSSSSSGSRHSTSYMRTRSGSVSSSSASASPVQVAPRVSRYFEPSKTSFLKRKHSVLEAPGSPSSSQGLPVKQAKLNHHATASALPANEALFERKSASLRRALSLQSNASQDSPKKASASARPTARLVTSNYKGLASTKVSPVPIIAPPVDHTSKAPLTEEELARLRIRRFVEREKDLAFTDRDLQLQAEKIVVDKALLREILNWLLVSDPLRWDPNPRSPSSCSSDSCDSYASSLSIGDSFLNSHLLDQLVTSPETRFHAAHMFLRYFHLVGEPRIDPEICTSTTWDVALGCLALSVKFHRDFLLPLQPIHNVDFLDIAPHALEWEDLEDTQRDIMETFSYRLGGSPQLLLIEFYQALASLRQLTGSNVWWNAVQRETWTFLYRAIMQPGVIQFTISSLTASALIRGLLVVLIKKRELEAPWNVSVGIVSTPPAISEQCRERARTDTRRLYKDIISLQSIPENHLKLCLKWFTVFLDE